MAKKPEQEKPKNEAGAQAPDPGQATDSQESDGESQAPETNPPSEAKDEPMKHYEIIAESVTIQPGCKLALTKSQAVNRDFALRLPENDKDIKDGHVYDVLKPVGFRQGEVFGCDAELPYAVAREVKEK